MNLIIVFSAMMFSVGVFLILLEIVKLPKSRTAKVLLIVNKRDRKKTRNYEVITLEIAQKLSRFIYMNEYKKAQLEKDLGAGGIALTPRVYKAKALVKAGFILLGIIPALAVFPIISIGLLMLSIAVYFKEMDIVNQKIKEKREEIEYELPRFANTLMQEFKASRDVLSILESYKNNAGAKFKRELEITIADMKSGSYESALIRLKARVGSTKLAEIIRGLIGVIRGDNGVVHFQILAHDLKMLEVQRLKTVAMKRPGKLKKYSFMLVACFVLTIAVIMAIEIMTAMGNLY